MIMIVCVDDNFGMMFNKRRQSRDKKLCEHILKLTQNTNLLMNAYSAKLFSEQQNIVIREDFLEAAQEQDYCFVENAEWLKYQEKITKLSCIVGIGNIQRIPISRFLFIKKCGNCKKLLK